MTILVGLAPLAFAALLLARSRTAQVQAGPFVALSAGIAVILLLLSRDEGGILGDPEATLTSFFLVGAAVFLLTAVLAGLAHRSRAAALLWGVAGGALCPLLWSLGEIVPALSLVLFAFAFALLPAALWGVLTAQQH